MEQLPKICIVTNLDFDDSQTLLYANTILTWGYALTVICPGTIPKSISNYEIDHRRLPLPTHNFGFHSSILNVFGGLLQRLSNSITALYYLLVTKPDICICIQPDVWAISVLSKLFLHNRIVVDLREIYEDRSSAFPIILQPIIRRLLRFIFRALSKYTDEIIHVSVARKNHYSYLLKPGIVISPFPRLEYYRNRRSTAHNSSISIVHAGSLRWTYASEQFIESIPMVLKRVPAANFVVIGGITSKLRNEALLNALIRVGKLTVIPRISYEEVIEVLLQSDIGISLVLPLDQTHILAMPRKLFEYLAAGLPVVAANVPTLQEVVESSECGVLVDPNSPASIASGILQLALSNRLRQKFGKNGRRACEAKYNWQNESMKLHNLLMAFASG